MRLSGEGRDILIQKRVELVQSGHFKRNVDSLSKKDINGITDIILLDYMGSAEFEWGSLPCSLKRMTINKDFYKVFVFNQYKDEIKEVGGSNDVVILKRISELADDVLEQQIYSRFSELKEQLISNTLSFCSNKITDLRNSLRIACFSW